jgi:hypothetical protein
VPGAVVPAITAPTTNCSSEMSAAAPPVKRATRAAPAAPDLRAARARAIGTMASPAAGSLSVRANCAATAVPCPAIAAAIEAPDAVSFGLGAGTDRPAIQDSA